MSLSPGNKDLYFDHETNGLLPELKVIHCLGLINIRTLEEFYYGPAIPKGHPLWTPVLGNPAGTVEDGLKALEDADMTVAHNGIDFDYKAIEILYPEWKRPARAYDSYVMAKAVWPVDTLLGPDIKLANAGRMPKFLMKSHGLKAWGYRLGENKDDYDGDRDKYPEPSDRLAKAGDERYDRRWEEWNPWLASYMMQDCRPGVKLWKLIEERTGHGEKLTAVTWPASVFEVEHEVARIIKQQELDGVHFDIEKARILEAQLLNEEARIKQALIDTFGSWWQPGKVQTPARAMERARADLPPVTIKRFGKTGKELAPYVGPPKEGYSPDAPFTPIERIEFSPSSRDHLGMRLQALYGWKPKKFGAGRRASSGEWIEGKPTVDETVLDEIPEATVPREIRQLLMDFFVVAKTLGNLCRGQNSWIRLATRTFEATGKWRIHGRMDTLGAITSRATHKTPNLSAVPAVLKEKVTLPDGTKTEQVVRGLKGRYGWECRELFSCDPGQEQTGVDASSLELIMLGHYMWPHDDGQFSARVTDPSRDPHQEHADLIDSTRGDAKTTVYLKVFGGGAYKLSLSLTVADIETHQYLSYRGLPMILRNLVTRFDQKFVDNLDDNQKARIAKAKIILNKFDEHIVGLKTITDLVSAAAMKGWLVGLDGRKLISRKAYSALNLLLQSGGAMAVKVWMMLLHRRLIAEGLVPGVDFKQMTWSHDEFQFSHRPGLGPLIAKCAKETIKEAGIHLKLKGELRADAKTGLNWATCH